jgi:hypothetical protein
METLTKLFGSAAKVKIIKLFVFNSNHPYDAKQIAERTKESVSKVRTELHNLDKMRLIHSRVFFKNVEARKNGRKVTRKVKTTGWVLNDDFESLDPLRYFLVNTNHLTHKELIKKLSRGGALKLLIISGVFIQNAETRVDLLVVGDHLKRRVVENAIRTIEAEIGKEIRYAIFETAEFKYRLGMYDKLIRDILDFPHEKILNKFGAV